MNYFIMNFTGENKVWKGYFPFAYGFLYQENRNVDFYKIYRNKNLENLKIQALHQGGEVVRDIALIKGKMPLFCKISDVFLIREDIFRKELFQNLDGIEFFDVEAEGIFPFKYKMLSFKSVLNCIDFEQSVRNQFDFLSKLVLDKSKIPENINGFFLSDWDIYGGFRCIVDDKLKSALLQLHKASDFLKFKMV